MRRTSHVLRAGLLAAAVAITAPACASGYYASYGYRGQRDVRQYERVAYDNGYREGIEHGGHDARDRRDYRVDRDRDYRRGDEGYRREYGDRDFYREAFRRGYEAGYRAGFQQYARRGDWRR
jgi:hypothetical protein